MLVAVRKVLSGLTAGVSAVAGFLSVGSALVIALISVIVTYNVVQRFTFGFSIPGIIDLSALVLVIIAFGGAAQGELDETHVRVSLVADRVGPKVRKVILLVSQFFISALAVVMLQATYERAVASYLVNEVQNAQKYLPVWPVRFFIVIGLLVLLAVCIVKIVQVLAPVRGAGDNNSGDELPNG